MLGDLLVVFIAFASLHLTAISSSPTPQNIHNGENRNSTTKTYEADISTNSLRRPERSTVNSELTPDTFPLPCAMAPSNLKSYLEGVVNSTLHPETWKYSTLVTPITCAMSMAPRLLRQEIFDFGRFPDKFFLNLPADISAENFRVATTVWQRRLRVFQHFLDKMESTQFLPPSPAASLSEDARRSSSPSSVSTSHIEANVLTKLYSASTTTPYDSVFRDFLQQLKTSTPPPPRGNIVESSESELRMWKLIVIIAVVVVIVLALVYSVAQTAKCVLSVRSPFSSMAN